MIAYIDASVVLRIILREPAPLAEWQDLHEGISSALIAIECARTFDRLWLEGRLTDHDVTLKRTEAATLLTYFELVPLNEQVLTTAALPLPTPLGALDGIHLASAIIHRASQPADERPVVFATHDLQLARAARAMRFDVIGAPA